MDADDLLDRARDAFEASYAPYSEYAVGAALLTEDGTVYTGCNIETANYSNSLHAEEVALGSAVRDGHQAFEALAVASAARDGVTPCGMCRQTLAEFCDEDFEIHCGTGTGRETYTLGDLLPEPISAGTLDVETEDDR
jgi:cytidine deaminase